MKRISLLLIVSAGLFVIGGEAGGRGFGGGRGGFGGGRGFGGFDRGYGGFDRGFSSFSGADRMGGLYSGSRATDAYSGWGGRGFGTTYDHTWTDAAGGSLNTAGRRGAYEGPFGGVAAGGTRDATLTTASGKTFSADREGGAVSGPMGRTAGGAAGTVDGRYGTSNWETAFSGNRYAGPMNHYASVYGANGLHSTAYWSTGYMGTRAAYVRGGFGYFGCFYPGWYTAHPGCWVAAGWAAGAAWAVPTYIALANYCGMNVAASPDYDFGSTVVLQDNNVYMNGQDVETTNTYAQQATTIALQGQSVNPPLTDDWKPLGVFALVQGDEKTSNNIVQLAINKAGIIRGNYYNGLTDTNTEVFGSVDNQTQRAAWTIGKKTDRVFEAGLYNLTLPECPCLLHLGAQATQQLLLVRMQQPKKAGS